MALFESDGLEGEATQVAQVLAAGFVVLGQQPFVLEVSPHLQDDRGPEQSLCPQLRCVEVRLIERGNSGSSERCRPSCGAGVHVAGEIMGFLDGEARPWVFYAHEGWVGVGWGWRQSKVHRHVSIPSESPATSSPTRTAWWAPAKQEAATPAAWPSPAQPGSVLFIPI